MLMRLWKPGISVDANRSMRFRNNENEYFWKRISVDRALEWRVENASKR